jgi:hypothetical protein
MCHALSRETGTCDRPHYPDRIGADLDRPPPLGDTVRSRYVKIKSLEQAKAPGQPSIAMPRGALAAHERLEEYERVDERLKKTT